MSQNPTFPYTILQWTSRAEVCERLHRFLLETPTGDSQDVPFDPTHRVRAGELLALLDDLPGSLYRMALLRRSDEEPWLQRVTLESLLASDAVVSPQALLQLLTSQTVSNQSGELLNLCRTPELVESVRGWIQTNSIAGCANLLASVNVPWVHAWGWPWWGEDVKPPQAVLDLLYEGCFRVDAVQGSQEILQPDAYVTMAAALMADRPEARAFLERHWTDRSAWTFEALGPLVAWHPECLGSLLSAGAPPLRDFPLEVLQLRGMRLDQPEPAARALIQHYGTGELLLHLEERIRRPPPADHSSGIPDNLEFLLTELPEGEADGFITSLLGCPDVPESAKCPLRDALWERFWRFSREQAGEQVRECLEQPAWDKNRVEDALYRAASDPRAADHKLLWWSTEQEDHPEYAFAGIVGLETLGEAGEEWRSRLRQLSGSSDTSVRLLANAALVRGGDLSRLEEIERSARRFPGSDEERRHLDHEQGLALRLLGELDAARYVGLMRAVLLQRLPEEYNGSPEQEAAYALARLATPEAVTALLRGYFIASEYLRRKLRRYLPAAVARMEGEDAPLVNQIDLWRYARIPP